MKTKEAIERVKNRFDKWALDEEDLTALQALGLVDIDSEDERIRKKLISYLTDIIDRINSEEDISHDAKILGGNIRRWIAYLERQKDSDKAMSAIEKIDKYISSHTANAHDMNDSNPNKKYYSGVDDTLSDIAGILIAAYSADERRGEQPTNEEMIRTLRTEYEKGVADTIAKYEQKSAGDTAFERWLDDWYQGSKEAGGDVVMSETEFKNWSREIRNMYQQNEARKMKR